MSDSTVIDPEKRRKSEALHKLPEQRFIRSNALETSSWHIGRKRFVFGMKSGLAVRAYYLTLCSGRSLGGPWGQEEVDEQPEGTICPRCQSIAQRLNDPGLSPECFLKLVASEIARLGHRDVPQFRNAFEQAQFGLRSDRLNLRFYAESAQRALQAGILKFTPQHSYYDQAMHDCLAALAARKLVLV